MKRISVIFICLALSVFYSCGGKKDSGGNPPPQPPASPSKAALLIPAQNQVCATGDDQTATQNTVLFDWADADNAEKYTLTVKNLLTGLEKTIETAKSDSKVALARATPYSWTITSRSSKTTTTAQSDTWKFYNSGVGVTSYAPFPAALTYPAMGQAITSTTDSLTLTWTGSDVDGDLKTYDVYFGAATPPALTGTLNAPEQKTTIKITHNTIYYWKIISKDSKGNTSDSGIGQFKIN